MNEQEQARLLEDGMRALDEFQRTLDDFVRRLEKLEARKPDKVRLAV